MFWCLTQAINSQDATFKLPLGFSVSVLDKSQRTTPVGPKKTPCCADPVRMGQPWSCAFPEALLGSRKGISIFITAHLAPLAGSKNKELELKCSGPYHLLLLVKSTRSLIGRRNKKKPPSSPTELLWQVPIFACTSQGSPRGVCFPTAVQLLDTEHPKRCQPNISIHKHLTAPKERLRCLRSALLDQPLFYLE